VRESGHYASHYTASVVLQGLDPGKFVSGAAVHQLFKPLTASFQAIDLGGKGL